MFWYIAGFIGIAVVAFIVWRFTSVARGARQRDQKLFTLIGPIGEKLAAGDELPSHEIHSLAALPQLRCLLFELLKHHEQLDIFPGEYLSEVAQAETRLAYWMMHPNELQDAPDAIELVETVPRTVAGEKCRFHVFKYTMPKGHWAGGDWLLGLAGPYFGCEPPYSGIAGAFSRCGDKLGDVQPSDLVDWYVAMATRKGGMVGAGY